MNFVGILIFKALVATGMFTFTFPTIESFDTMKECISYINSEDIKTDIADNVKSIKLYGVTDIKLTNVVCVPINTTKS